MVDVEIATAVDAVASNHTQTQEHRSPQNNRVTFLFYGLAAGAYRASAGGNKRRIGNAHSFPVVPGGTGICSCGNYRGDGS